MKNKFLKVFLLIFAIALIAVAVWFYQVFQSRKVQPIENAANNQTEKTNQASGEQPISSSKLEENISPDQDLPSTDLLFDTENSNTSNANNGDSAKSNIVPFVSTNDKNSGKGDMFAHITTEHCDMDCKAFIHDFQFLEYCQQVCGIAPIESVTNCDKEKDLQKDYCNKDLAITRGDSSLCGKIKDINIKQTCQNRILQDIVENQK